MCFTKEMSGSFALGGLFMAYWVQAKTGNTLMAVGIFYFFLMEFLQFFQYLVIDDCDSQVNQVLTVLGFLHICFQPYFTHILNISLTNSSTLLTSWVVILRICIIQGLWLFSRFVQAYVQGPDSYADKYAVENSTEWLRGEKLCTTSGKFHLAWEVPMADVSYYVPSAAIHSFMMFMPFFVLHPKMIVQGAVLWLTGPALAALVTTDLKEQASIWCFFSIAQIAAMLMVVRGNMVDAAAQKKAKAAAKIRFTWYGWPLGLDSNKRK